MSAWQVYWVFGVLANLGYIFLVMLIFCTIYGFCSTKKCAENGCDTECRGHNGLIIAFAFSIISILGMIFSPSKDLLTKMYIIPYVTQNKDIKELPINLAKYINKELAKDE